MSGSRVDVVDLAALVVAGDGVAGRQVAEEVAEAYLGVVVEAVLIAEEEHLVGEQGAADVEGRDLVDGRQVDAVDDGAQGRAEALDAQSGRRGGSVGGEKCHDNLFVRCACADAGRRRARSLLGAPHRSGGLPSGQPRLIAGTRDPDIS